MATVFGICKDPYHLQRTVEALRLGGFRNVDIAVLHPDRRRDDEGSQNANARLAEDVGAGAGTGMILGGVLGFLASIVSLFFPGLSPLVPTEPLTVSLVGAGVGGILGGLTGVLIGGLSLQELTTKNHEAMATSRGIVLSIHAGSPEWMRKAQKILAECLFTDVFTASEAVCDTQSFESDRLRSSGGNF